MERCDCKTNGPCLKLRDELPAKQKCVEGITKPLPSDWRDEGEDGMDQPSISIGLCRFFQT